jgi:hypothetical protein
MALISVTISGNAAPLKKSLGESETALDKFAGNAKKIGVAAVAAFGAAAAGITVAIGKASDLQETISKVGVIFGDANDKVAKFAKTAATTLGQTQQQALDAAATFGIFGKSAGLSGDALADFSTGFTTLASDLASFNNTSPEQAINAIGAALRGESEPLRQYGVLLNDATLKQAALELGIYNGNGALTAQQKILAAQKVIYEQTADAQGDFERTSDGLANKQRILSAQIQNVVTDLGKVFLPIALEVATVIADILTPTVEFLNERVFPKLSEITRKVTEFLRDGTIPVFETLRDKVSEVTAIVRDNEDAFRNLKVFLQDFVAFVRDRVAPNFEKILGGSLALVATRDIPKLINGFFKVAGVVSQVGSFIIKMVDATIDAIEILINGILEGVNFIIRQLNRIPGVNIGEIGSVDFNPSRPSGSTPSLPNFLGSPDRLPSPALQVPGVGGSLETPGAGGGGGGGGGSSRGGGGGGGTTINAGTINFAAPIIDYAALGRTESAYLADIALGGIPTGLEYLSADFSESARLADAGLLDTAQNINITVNTVTADENLPTVIVDALQRYNLIYGPAEIEIAI